MGLLLEGLANRSGARLGTTDEARQRRFGVSYDIPASRHYDSGSAGGLLHFGTVDDCSKRTHRACRLQRQKRRCTYRVITTVIVCMEEAFQFPQLPVNEVAACRSEFSAVHRSRLGGDMVVLLKAGFRRSFKHHDCSGTASQATRPGCHQHANASGSKLVFELATDGIHFCLQLRKNSKLHCGRRPDGIVGRKIAYMGTKSGECWNDDM